MSSNGRSAPSRACDTCRKRKVRCDGPHEGSDTRCSRCTNTGIECSYRILPKKRKTYVETLEAKVDKLEGIISELMERTGAIDYDDLGCKWSLVDAIQSAAKAPSAPQNSINVLTDEAVEDDAEAYRSLLDMMKEMSMGTADDRFFGPSSGEMLIKTALETVPGPANVKFTPMKRPQFWVPRPWETRSAYQPRSAYIFPESDLLLHLIQVYFETIHIYLPFLHRPTFERLVWREKLHLVHETFGAVVLLVCAVASRWSDDPRVILDGTDSSKYSAGWKWFEQVYILERSVLQPASLYDIQFYCLATEYMYGTSYPHVCMTIVGLGLRLAQDMGAHRKREVKTVEDELWKRAFWFLVHADRVASAFLGRPCAIHDENFDLDLPHDCDDEYWENADSAQCFKQPEGKLSTVTYFIQFLNLMSILAWCLRTLYSIKKFKVIMGVSDSDDEHHFIVDLEISLEKWRSSVPMHLQWSENQLNPIFFNQSTALFSWYYYIDILIHRPFISSFKKKLSLDMPALERCTNAARACTHILYVQSQRIAIPMPYTETAAFTSGVILLFKLWCTHKRSEKDMEYVQQCLKVLTHCEERQHSAGQAHDILADLATGPSSNVTDKLLHGTENCAETLQPSFYGFVMQDDEMSRMFSAWFGQGGGNDSSWFE